MSAPNKKGQVKTSIGQGVDFIIISVDGVEMPMLPIKNASAICGLAESTLRLKCNSLELIAIKISNLWFIHELEVYRLSKAIRQKRTK